MMPLCDVSPLFFVGAGAKKNLFSVFNIYTSIYQLREDYGAAVWSTRPSGSLHVPPAGMIGVGQLQLSVLPPQSMNSADLLRWQHGAQRQPFYTGWDQENSQSAPPSPAMYRPQQADPPFR